MVPVMNKSSKTPDQWNVKVKIKQHNVNLNVAHATIKDI